MHLIWYWLVAFQDAEGKFPCILGHEGAGYDPFQNTIPFSFHDVEAKFLLLV
jgi:hypothetical protein